MAVFLFVVDWLWTFILLQMIGVLQFGGGGGIRLDGAEPAGRSAPP